MWELWRAHDVFEAGTVLDANGIPVPGSRALPDGEILAGTPTPALFHCRHWQWRRCQQQLYRLSVLQPGVAGHRPPKPPLDTIDDGGLPRHIITGGTFVQAPPDQNHLDFSKDLVTAIAPDR